MDIDSVDELPDVSEPVVTFKSIGDLKFLRVNNRETGETMVVISGYDLRVAFNMEHIRTVEDANAAAEGLAALFKESILDQLLNSAK